MNISFYDKNKKIAMVKDRPFQVLPQTIMPENVLKKRDFAISYYREYLLKEEDVGYKAYYIHNHCPMKHAVLIVEKDSNGKKHLKEIYFEEDHLIKRRLGEDIIDLGYNYYCALRNAKISTNRELTPVIGDLNRESWRSHFMKFLEIVEEVIKKNGCVQVHLDGNLYNNEQNNIAMLHIVDTMMLFTKRHLKEKELNVFLKSESLQDISVFDNMKDHFFDINIVGNMLRTQFFFWNQDFLYLYLGYFENYSDFPIRLNVPEIGHMPKCRKVNLDPCFRQHQLFKMNQLKYILRGADWQRKSAFLD